MPEKSLTQDCSTLGMEIVDGTEPQLQHFDEDELDQKHEPSNDSTEPSGDSSNPSDDSSQPSGGFSKLSSRPSSGNTRLSGDSSKSLSDRGSQPEPEISKSKLSESEYSSTESGKQEQPKQTETLMNQAINENILNTKDLSVTNITSADQQLPEIPNQQLDSSAKGDDPCVRLSRDSLNSDKITSETSNYASEPTLETLIEGSKVDRRSVPSVSSDNTKNSSLFPAMSSSQHLYPDLQDFESSTSGQDFTESMPMNRVNCNENNSSARKRTHDTESKPQLLASESESSSEQESYNSTVIKCALIYYTIVFLIAGLYGILPASTPSSNDSPLEQFSTYVHKMKLNFPSQDQIFWKTLEASPHRILKKNVSKYPAVILMASSLKHASVALGIARNVSSAFDLSVGLSPDSTVIDLKDYKHLNADEQKSQLVNLLNSALGTYQRRSVVLENLQCLDPLAAVLFYNFCDNAYAPFKDVLIILNLYFDDEKEKIDNPGAVENYLEMIWSKGLATDKVKPLLSRVANHIVIVQGESPM